MAEQRFNFPHDMKAQGAVKFLELKGQVYPTLVREFYANFRYKDGIYWSMISGKLFELDENLFMNVGGLSANGYGIGDCAWVKESFDAAEVYKSFLRGPHLYVQGELTKAGSLSVENRLLHYLIAYILVQRNTNHAQPTVNDLHFMYTVKNNVMINWPEEILKGEPSGTASQEPGFGLDDLDAMELRLNNRMDLHSQELKDSYHADLEQYEERLTAYHDNQYQNMRNLKLTLLIRGEQNIAIPDDTAYPPPSQP
ncbi:unnamed protein product [Lupinus luteus]|uniref:Uncharacterized protein n=1 Tax=Lupinus luteus TaxID=3873 RepID=A0AAV1YC46_LUPLU